jgi:hypothetical protein
VYFANSSTAAAYHAPRFDYSPTTIGEPRGLLIEQSVKNFMLQSQALSGLNPYGMIAISIDGTVPDPMGGAETKKIAADGTTALHAFLRFVTADTATTVTVSIFAKKNGYKYLYLSEGTTNTAAARFNLETGVSDAPVVGAGYVSSKTTPYPNGWWRCEMVANITASSNRGWAIGAAPNSGVTYSVNGVTYLGSNNSNDGIYAFGWQVEAGSGASSYIPTGASQVTRNADYCTIPTASFIPGNPYPQTLFVDCIPNTPSGAFLDIARIFDRTIGGTFSYGTEIYYYTASTMTVSRKIAASTNTERSFASGLAYGTRHKFALSIDASSYSGSYDGVTALGVATAPTALATVATHLGIGCSGDSSPNAVMFGTIRQIKFYPTALSQSAINTLTTL